MPIHKRRNDFLNSEEGREIRQKLQQIVLSESHNTTSSYTPNGEYPDNLISFVDKHMNYLCANPAMDAEQYVANLRLKTKNRT